MGFAEVAAFKARAGAAIIDRLANAEARVVDFAFPGIRRDEPTDPLLGGAGAQSRRIEFDAKRADVDAAPVDLHEDCELAVDGVCWTIFKRTDRTELGQVSFLLEPRR